MSAIKGYKTYIGFVAWGLFKIVTGLAPDWIDESTQAVIEAAIVAFTGVSLRAGIKKA